MLVAKWSHAVRVRQAFDCQSRGRGPACFHRYCAGESGGAHSRQGGDFVHDLLLDPRDLLGIFEALRGKPQSRRLQCRDVGEPRIDTLERSEGPDHEP